MRNGSLAAETMVPEATVATGPSLRRTYMVPPLRPAVTTFSAPSVTELVVTALSSEPS